MVMLVELAGLWYRKCCRSSMKFGGLWVWLLSVWFTALPEKKFFLISKRNLIGAVCYISLYSCSHDFISEIFPEDNMPSGYLYADLMGITRDYSRVKMLHKWDFLPRMTPGREQ